ncbi:hypothetical protein M9Y10_006823 [Tritrichomonas musculus]|uniref:Uncharacterized protein n=1 Tax=Tritrichomonas musculus TaxID=1915356 RepID=A0ABR2JF73_9EUKA
MNKDEKFLKVKEKDERIKYLLEQGYGYKEIAESIGETVRFVRNRIDNFLSSKPIEKQWTPEEKTVLCEKAKIFNFKWDIICSFLPGRTKNAVINMNSYLEDDDRPIRDLYEVIDGLK